MAAPDIVHSCGIVQHECSELEIESYMDKFMLYSPMRTWKPMDPPTSPFVSIALGDSMETDGYCLLSGQLMTEMEIDIAVDDLVKQLNGLRIDAKKELQSRPCKCPGTRMNASFPG